MGCTVTQLPEVTSVSAASVTSVTLVDPVKSTVAVPVSSVTWIVLPATTAINPATCSLPVAGADEVAEDPVVLGDVVVVGPDLFDELQDPADIAVTPAMARIASWLNRGLGERVDINVSPILSADRA
jgi:hypothetical protein